MVQFRGMLFHIAFPNKDKIFGYQLFLNDTTVDYKKMSNEGLKNCYLVNGNEIKGEVGCIPDRSEKYDHVTHHVIPIPYLQVDKIDTKLDIL